MSRFERAWWLALLVLIANDHLLKQAGILPGWLTGKLSDFAGLIVAPVLVAGVLRAHGTRPRCLAFGLVVALFTAIKVSPNAARIVEATAAWMGIPSRIWCDASDLVALAVLPLAWRISPAWTARSALGPVRGGRRAAAVIVGALACVATSAGLPRGFRTSAYLVNTTVDSIEVRLYRARGPLDCAALASDAGNALSSPFDAALCARLGPGGVLPLDRTWSLLESDAGIATPSDLPPCDAVIVRVAGLPDTLLTWQSVNQVAVVDPASRVRDEVDPHAIYLERAGERLFAAASPLITARPSPIPLPEVDCGASPPAADGRAGP